MMQPTEAREVTIRTKDYGEQVLAGLVSGPLAVTPVFYGDGRISMDGYTVTHVATGMDCDWRKYGRDLTKTEALELLGRLLAAGLDWEFERFEDLPPRTKAEAPEIIRTFLVERGVWG
jgi:hypothetical protein